MESSITSDEWLQLNRGCCYFMRAMVHEGFPFISLINLLQLVLSVCVAAVKCLPVLHHCVFIIFLLLRDYGLYHVNT